MRPRPALLDAYRRLVRDVVRRSGGAEIKTEGDSFYVVFPSASDAVRCGLALVAAAAARHDRAPGATDHRRRRRPRRRDGRDARGLRRLGRQPGRPPLRPGRRPARCSCQRHRAGPDPHERRGDLHLARAQATQGHRRADRRSTPRRPRHPGGQDAPRAAGATADHDAPAGLRRSPPGDRGRRRRGRPWPWPPCSWRGPRWRLRARPEPASERTAGRIIGSRRVSHPRRADAFRYLPYLRLRLLRPAERADRPRRRWQRLAGGGRLRRKSDSGAAAPGPEARRRLVAGRSPEHIGGRSSGATTRTTSWASHGPPRCRPMRAARPRGP